MKETEVLEVKTTFSNSWYILRKNGKNYLLDMTSGNYFNKEVFLIWLKKKKAHVLSSEEAEILVRAQVFTQNSPSKLIVFGVLGALYLVEKLQIHIPFSLRLVLLVLAPVLLFLFLRSRVVAEKKQFEQLLNKKIDYNELIQVTLYNKKEKASYAFRRIIGFVFLLLFAAFTALAFFLTGYFSLLFLYALFISLVFGPIYPCPVNDRCTAVDFVQMSRNGDSVKNMEL